jgi:hypothetical protein
MAPGHRTIHSSWTPSRGRCLGQKETRGKLASEERVDQNTTDWKFIIHSLKTNPRTNTTGRANHANGVQGWGVTVVGAHRACASDGARMWCHVMNL